MTATSTITRAQVTNVRGFDHRGRQRITHPWVWIWTDPDGYERCYDSKAAALAAQRIDTLERAEVSA